MREQEQCLAAVTETQGQRTKDAVKKMVEAEVALLLPHIAILLRHELDATDVLPPMPQQEQEAEGKGGSATEALSGVGRTLASVWADPWVANLRKEWLVYLVQVLTWVYYVVITLLGIKLGFLVLRLFGIDFSD